MNNSARLAALQRTFTPPPPLKKSRPRNVRFTATGLAAVAASVAVLLLALAVGFGMYAEARQGDLPLWAPLAAAAAIASLGTLCLLALHRERNFLAEGRVSPAVVTGHRVQKSQHGTHRTMTYEFQLLNGAVRTGKGGTSDKPPAVGSVICVVYDPESPRRNRVYPFTLVTPDP
jgi:hypothetical protein